MSASLCLFRRHKHHSVSHQRTNTCSERKANLCLRSVSALCLKSTSALIPELPWGTWLVATTCRAHHGPNRAPQLAADGLCERACHTHPSEGAAGGPVQAGGSAHGSDTGLCASMLEASWMFQQSAVRSARRVGPNPTLLKPCCYTLPQKDCSSSMLLRCGRADADIELPGDCFGLFPQVYGKAGGIRTLGQSLPLRLLTIPVSKSCQHSALCLPLAFCCGVHLEWLGTLLELLNLAGVLKRRYIQY